MASLLFSLTAAAQWKAVLLQHHQMVGMWSVTQQPFYHNMAFQTKQCIRNNGETINYHSWVLDDVTLC